jgi:L-alanine-DL-glutamate epimerase-like enolase superfamily enzyme
MKIADVEVTRVRQPEWSDTDEWCTSPMDAFFNTSGGFRDRSVGLFNSPVEMRTDPVFYVLVRVKTDEGLEGLGGIGLGSEAMAQVVEHYLRPLVVGASPFDVELLWEKMYRSTLNVGRKGMLLEAISGVDIALWDVMGKATGQPVYNLLGGRTRERIRAYASRLYPQEDLDRLTEEARRYVAEGFTAVKMRFGYGPKDGRAGMRKNRKLVQTVREAVGQDVEVMADAYMGWTPDYAIAMIRKLEEFDLAWVEEPVMPDDVAGYARIRASVRTPIAGGEHEFTRWGFKELIEKGAVDILQPDVNRVGGITEARKIWALASAHHMPVVPHSGNIHNLHLVVSHMNSPLAESFPRRVRDADTSFSELFMGEPVAESGYIGLPDRPGLGVEASQEVLESLSVSVDGQRLEA